MPLKACLSFAFERLALNLLLVDLNIILDNGRLNDEFVLGFQNIGLVRRFEALGQFLETLMSLFDSQNYEK